MSHATVEFVLKYELERLRLWMNVEGGLSQTNEEACKLFYVLFQLVKNHPELKQELVDIVEEDGFYKQILFHLMPDCPIGKDMLKLP